MDNRDSTEILYDMFERGYTDEMIQKQKKYDIKFIKDIRYKYNLFKEEEE